MNTLSFNIIKTPENHIGIAILDGLSEVGLLTVQLDNYREAIAYIRDGVVYVYSADPRGHYSPAKQIDNFLRYERQRTPGDFILIAKGVTKIDWVVNGLHLSIGGVLLASVYFDDTKSLLIIDRKVNDRSSSVGLDIYDSDIGALLVQRGSQGISTLVLAIHDVLCKAQSSQSLYSGKLH